MLLLERLESRHLLSAAGLAEGESTVFSHIPQDLTGLAGQQVVAPVQIDNAGGIRGAEIRIKYDTSILDASDGSIQAGSVWPDTNTEVVANVDDATGTIIAWVFHPEALPSGSGSLLEVRFAIRADAPAGTSTSLDFAKLRINEGDIVPNPEPVEGTDPTDGRVTIGTAAGTSSLSGFVYADTNTNNQPDPFEGVPLVTITLVDLNSGQTWQDVTDDDGRYDFDDLAAGSYEIRQTQPAAFLDGGPNEISLTLTAGQDLANQNFRERGLRPEYVYTRLFTTPVMPVGSVAWRSAIRQIVADAEQDAAVTESATAMTTLALLPSSQLSQVSETTSADVPFQDGSEASHVAVPETVEMPEGAEGESADMHTLAWVETPAAAVAEEAKTIAAASSSAALPPASPQPVEQPATGEGEWSDEVLFPADELLVCWPAPSAGDESVSAQRLADSPALESTAWFAASSDLSSRDANGNMTSVATLACEMPNDRDGGADVTSYYPAASADAAQPAPRLTAGASSQSLFNEQTDLLFATDDLGLL